MDRIVCIEWEDSCTDTGWHSKEYAGKHCISTCHTVGYLLKNNKKGVVVFQSKSEATGEVSEMIAIPRKVIKSLRYLKE